jgi:cytoskeletal protein RodZ
VCIKATFTKSTIPLFKKKSAFFNTVNTGPTITAGMKLRVNSPKILTTDSMSATNASTSTTNAAADIVHVTAVFTIQPPPPFTMPATTTTTITSAAAAAAAAAAASAAAASAADNTVSSTATATATTAATNDMPRMITFAFATFVSSMVAAGSAFKNGLPEQPC